MTIENFRQRIKTLVARGYSEEKASRIAELLGDIIEETNSRWVVRDEDGNVVDMIDPI
jgi:hypothetical protein